MANPTESPSSVSLFHEPGMFLQMPDGSMVFLEGAYVSDYTVTPDPADCIVVQKIEFETSR